jgi:hypothetical protein
MKFDQARSYSRRMKDWKMDKLECDIDSPRLLDNRGRATGIRKLAFSVVSVRYAKSRRDLRDSLWW